MRADTNYMKLSILAKRLLAAASTAATALAITSCGAGNTVDFVYVTSNHLNPGQINAFAVDSESGALVQIKDSPYPSGGRNPVYDVTSPDGKFLYVANHDDNTIVMFAAGSDGKLYPLQTQNTPGTEPVALAINSTGTDLYVLDYYAPASPGQPSYTDLNPGPGAVIILPINANGTMGAPLSVGAANYWQVQCFPTNLTLTPDGNFVYVTNTNAVVTTTSPPVTGTVPTLPASCPNYGTVSGFSIVANTGLTSVTGSPFSTGTGSEPAGIAADPGSGFLYVTDAALNQLYTFSIQPGTTHQAGGELSLTSTVGAGTQPMGATVVSNSSGKFLYVTNYVGGSISSYALAGGTPVSLTSTTAGASGPLCILADPRLGRFLYTADYTGGQIGGAELDPSTGSLIANKGSPYVTSGQPTCLAAVTHSHGNPNGLQ